MLPHFGQWEGVTSTVGQRWFLLPLGRPGRQLGGRRIDLETVMRMHVHQKSDRPDIGAGVVLAFRHAAGGQPTMDLALHGLDPNVNYDVRHGGSGHGFRAAGRELMAKLPVTIPRKPGSAAIVYRKAGD